MEYGQMLFYMHPFMYVCKCLNYRKIPRLQSSWTKYNMFVWNLKKDILIPHTLKDAKEKTHVKYCQHWKWQEEVGNSSVHAANARDFLVPNRFVKLIHVNVYKMQVFTSLCSIDTMRY